MGKKCQTDKQNLVSIFRGVAIIMVLIVHVSQVAFPEGFVKALCAFGQMGCQVFFVMSGYCLCHSLNSNSVTTLGFYRKRLLSLVPGYWIAIVVSVVISLLFPFVYHTCTRPGAIVQNLLLLNGLSLDWEVMNNVVCGGWFIGTLMIFYAIFPFLFRLYFFKNARWERYRIVVFPSVIILGCWAIMVISGVNNETFCENCSTKYFCFVNQLPSFVVGIVLFDIVRKGWADAVLSIVFFVVTIIMFFFPRRMSFIICPTSMSFAVALFFAFLNKRAGWKRGLLCYLGDKSYSVYLSHIWAISISVFLCPRDVGLFLALMFIVVLILLFTYAFDELLKAVKLKLPFPFAEST